MELVPAMDVLVLTMADRCQLTVLSSLTSLALRCEQTKDN